MAINLGDLGLSIYNLLTGWTGRDMEEGLDGERERRDKEERGG